MMQYFLAIGANISSKMGVEGENLQGVYGGNELLEFNLHPNYKRQKSSCNRRWKCCNGLCKNNQKTRCRRGKSHL